MKDHQKLVSIFKYLSVGGLAFVADYLSFVLFHNQLGASIFWANLIGLTVGFLISFTGNRIFVFGSKQKEDGMHHKLYTQIALYIILLTLNTFISYLIISFLQNNGITPYIGKGIAMVFIVIWNYILYKKIIFKIRNEK